MELVLIQPRLLVVVLCAEPETERVRQVAPLVDDLAVGVVVVVGDDVAFDGA